MASLVPCLACHRHVRAAERSCPFCGTGLPALAAPPRRPTARLGRAATFAFGAAALTSAGCSSTPAPGVLDAGGGGADAPAIETDAPAIETDAGLEADAGDAIDAGIDAGGVAPPYGISPVDAGPGDDGGGTGNLYGAPPAP